MRRTALAVLAAALVAGCGGGAPRTHTTAAGGRPATDSAPPAAARTATGATPSPPARAVPRAARAGTRRGSAPGVGSAFARVGGRRCREARASLRAGAAAAVPQRGGPALVRYARGMLPADRAVLAALRSVRAPARARAAVAALRRGYAGLIGLEGEALASGGRSPALAAALRESRQALLGPAAAAGVPDCA